MSFYEHIMRKDEEEEGENYLYIVHTPCAMKIGEEILGWFLHRAKKALKIKRMGLKINLEKLPEHFVLENKLWGDNKKIKFSTKMVWEWATEKEEGVAPKSSGTKWRLGDFLINFIGQYTELYTVEEDDF
jgi:hypothetical protein